MFCNKCGNEVQQGQRFCGKCGNETSPKETACCKKCGNRLKADDRFCNACGEPVATQKERKSFCQYCGERFELGEKFCKKCGHNLFEKNFTLNPRMFIRRDRREPQKRQVAKGGNKPMISDNYKLFLLSHIVLAVLILSIFIFSFMASFKIEISTFSFFSDDHENIHIYMINPFELLEAAEELGFDELEDADTIGTVWSLSIIVLFICGLCTALLPIKNKRCGRKRSYIIATIFSGMQFIMSLILAIAIPIILEEETYGVVEMNATFVGWLSILLTLIAGVLSILIMIFRKKMLLEENVIEDDGGDFLKYE